ncbi:nuclear pore glycoprotein p62-like, partial [Lingula anatina]|uniref:Nuclear pore glycoprotein p62-like n=1 Tax=Lingula anatina TaxID=7574 RepID=A0A1S3IM90_LINAN
FAGRVVGTTTTASITPGNVSFGGLKAVTTAATAGLGGTATTSFGLGGAGTTTASLGLGGTPVATVGLGGTQSTSLGVGGATTTTPSLGGTTATTSSATTTTQAGTGFNLAVTSSSGLSLGGGLKFGVTATTCTPASSTGGFSLPVLSTATTTTALGTGTASTSVTSTTTTLPAMNYSQLEKAINKWTHELEEQEKIFIQQATQVNAWDRLLIENGEKITQLNSDVEKVKIDQQRLDHELDFILAQQKELEEMLVPLEKTIEQLPPISYQQHADLEREHTYQLAENIDGQLKRMAQDLKEIIEHLNATNTSQDSNDPIQQVSKILNAHMDSLQWVDQNTALLQRRVDEISKLAEQRRREQERNFRLAYN